MREKSNGSAFTCCQQGEWFAPCVYSMQKVGKKRQGAQIALAHEKIRFFFAKQCSP